MTGSRHAIWNHCSALALVAALTTFGHGAAFAQQTTKSLESEEILVTATRRTESVQSIPLTVNVFSGEDLADQGVSNFSDISALAPNVIWSDSGGGSMHNNITVRGISSNASSQGFDPGVGIYVDDVYVANQFGFNMAMLDIARIEVLKGPQGTLFGRNTTAGAIAIHTRAPDTKDAFIDGNLRIGNLDLVEGRIIANMPISDIAAFKVSALYRDRDGYKVNVVTNKRDINTEHFVGGRAQLLVKPTGSLDLLFTGEYFENDDVQDVLSCVDPAAGPFVGICAFNPTRESVFNDRAADNNSVNERQMWSLSLRANWRSASGFEITSITAYRDLSVHNDVDQDFVALDLVRSGFDVPTNHQFSQELRVATPPEKRLRGVAGVYYFDEHRNTIIPQQFTPMLLALFGVPPQFLPTSNVTFQTDSTLDTVNWAVFGQAQFDILPQLTADAGIRYSKDIKDFKYQQTGDPIFNGPLNISLVAPTDTGASFDAITYTGSLNWEITDDIRTYVRYATGYKSGGYQAGVSNLSAPFNPLVPFREENSDQWELGLKTEWLDGRLRFNAAAFAINYKDIQQQITVPAPPPLIGFSRFIGNVGSAKSEGFETELSYTPADWVSINANFGYQDSRYTRGALDGRRIQFAPKTTASFAVNIERPLWSNVVGIANFSAAYRSDMPLSAEDPASSQYLESPDVVFMNARIGVEFGDGNYGLYLWGDNIANKQRFADFVSGQIDAVHITPPRTYGVELRARF